MENEKSKTESTPQTFKYLDIITVIFVVVLVLSNIASSAKIIDWGFSLGSIRLSFDAGTLLFPISYIFGDVITEVYGFKRSRRIIWIGFGTLAFSALVFWLVQILPGEATWQANVGQEAYNLVLGGISSGGIIIASLVGFFAGSFSNAILMAVLKVLTKGKLLWTRTIGSTIVGEGADTFVFILVASALGVFPWSLFWSLTVTNYIFKVGLEAVMTPVTYWVVNGLKRLEGVDVFDKETNLSPFKFS
ncbi:MAG: queuosine precursor transporter [Anaerolineaceae bacterium]|nr:queuosine precursor transporter [Anaerolineaceae bacterium]